MTALRLRMRFARSSTGFTVIEVIAAISVFAIMTLGLTPLLVSSIRGSALSRSYTIGKNLTVEAMERIRGLPYFDQEPNRDVLDLYFPNLSTGYTAATKTFTTTCTSSTATPAASGARACPPKHADGTSRIPTGYTVTFAAKFVTPVVNTNPEQFSDVTPTATYSASAAATAAPPAAILQISVTTSWTNLGRTRQYQLLSYVGDRKLSPDRVRAVATVDFGVQALTSYKELSGRLSKLTSFVGRSSSDIEIRNFAAASTDETAGLLQLVQQEFNGAAPADLDSVVGARGGLRAPPNVNPGGVVTAAGDTIEHTALFAAVPVAALGSSAINEASPNPFAEVVSSLPSSAGNFRITGGVGSTVFWVDNQRDTAATTTMKLDSTAHLFEVFNQPSSSTVDDLSGWTSTTSTASTDPARKVEGLAHLEIPKLVLMPTTYITGDKGVIVITDFVADLTCRSNGLDAGAVATGSWSAKIKVWTDPNNNGLRTDAGYVFLNNGASGANTVSGSTTSGLVDVLAPLKASNVLVYDGVLLDDVYLFHEGNGVLDKKGYLSSWSAAFTIQSSKDRLTSRVSLPAAMSLTTALTNSSNEETALTLDIGKMACQAADKRG